MMRCPKIVKKSAAFLSSWRLQFLRWRRRGRHQDDKKCCHRTWGELQCIAGHCYAVLCMATVCKQKLVQCVCTWGFRAAMATQEQTQWTVTCRFPNPPGSNRCWMNATLQTLLGMEPFMEELERSCRKDGRNNQSALLQSFFQVVRHRRRGHRLSLHSALRWSNLTASITSADCCRHILNNMKHKLCWEANSPSAWQKVPALCDTMFTRAVHWSYPEPNESTLSHTLVA
jgi:hypothetical protein